MCLQAINSGKMQNMLEAVYSRYAAYCETHDFVMVEGPGPVMVSAREQQNKVACPSCGLGGVGSQVGGQGSLKLPSIFNPL